MADEKKTDSKNLLDKALDFAKSHWGEVFTLYHLFGSGKPNGHVEVPDSLKGMLEGLRGFSREGGRDSYEDERYYNLLLNKMKPNLRNFLLGWTAYEFPSHSTDWAEKKKADDAFEEWRMVVCGMDRDPAKVGTITNTTSNRVGRETKTSKEEKEVFDRPKSKALPFLNAWAQRIVDAFNDEVAKLGHTPSDDEKQACLQAAFALISEENRVRALPHMPMANEPHWTDRVNAFKEATPEKIHAVSGELRRFDRKLKRNRPKRGIQAAIRNWIS